MDEHVVLVAFTVEGNSPEEAQRALMRALTPLPHDPSVPVESWWIAQDNRLDGSDCDSAIFHHKGSAARAYMVLDTYGLTGAHNNPNKEN